MNDLEKEILIDTIKTKHCYAYNYCIKSTLIDSEQYSCLCPLFARYCSLYYPIADKFVHRVEDSEEKGFDYHANYGYNRTSAVFHFYGRKIGHYTDIRSNFLKMRIFPGKEVATAAINMYISIYGEDSLFEVLL